jgi:hypothetical protein
MMDNVQIAESLTKLAEMLIGGKQASRSRAAYPNAPREWMKYVSSLYSDGYSVIDTGGGFSVLKGGKKVAEARGAVENVLAMAVDKNLGNVRIAPVARRKTVQDWIDDIKLIELGNGEAQFSAYKGKKFRSLRDLQKFLSRFPKPDMGYDKVRMKVEFNDGEDLPFRYDHGKNDPDVRGYMEYYLKGRVASGKVAGELVKTSKSLMGAVDNTHILRELDQTISGYLRERWFDGESVIDAADDLDSDVDRVADLVEGWARGGGSLFREIRSDIEALRQVGEDGDEDWVDEDGAEDAIREIAKSYKKLFRQMARMQAM